MKAAKDFKIGCYEFKAGDDVSKASMYLKTMRQRGLVVEEVQPQTPAKEQPQTNAGNTAADKPKAQAQAKVN
jgi:hypothetical protein